MARKWTSPKLNVKLSGDIDAAKRLDKKARVYIGYLFDSLRGNQTYKTQSWTQGNGSHIRVTIWKDILGERALARIYAAGIDPVSEEDFRAPYSLWLPTGFVFVPKTDDASYGYGAPFYKYTFDDDELVIEALPYGTNKGVFRERMLNKYAHNRWPEHVNPKALTDEREPFTVAAVTSVRPCRMADTYEILPFNDKYETHIMGPWDTAFGIEPGSFTHNTFFRYASPEIETEGWHAHRMEPVLYSGLKADIFEQTLLASPQTLLHPPKGFASAGQTITNQIKKSGAYFHVHSAFDHETEHLVLRIDAMRGVNAALGENIQIAAGTDAAEDIVQNWLDSPSHKAVMKDDHWHLSPLGTGNTAGLAQQAGGTCLELGVTPSSTVSSYGLSELTGMQDIDPPYTGTACSQVYTRYTEGQHHNTLGAGGYTWIGHLGTVSARAGEFSGTVSDYITGTMANDIDIWVNGRKRHLSRLTSLCATATCGSYFRGAALRLDDASDWEDQDRLDDDAAQTPSPDPLYSAAEDTRKIPILTFLVVTGKLVEGASVVYYLRKFATPLDKYLVWPSDKYERLTHIGADFSYLIDPDLKEEITLPYFPVDDASDNCYKGTSFSYADFSKNGKDCLWAVLTLDPAHSHNNCLWVTQKTGSVSSNIGNFFEYETGEYTHEKRWAAHNKFRLHEHGEDPDSYSPQTHEVFYAKSTLTYNPDASTSVQYDYRIDQTARVLYGHQGDGLTALKYVRAKVDDYITVKNGVTQYPGLSGAGVFPKIYTDSEYEYHFERSIIFPSGRTFTYCDVEQTGTTRTADSFYCFFTEFDFEREVFTVLKVVMESSGIHPDSYERIDSAILETIAPGVDPDEVERYREMFWCVWGHYELVVYDSDMVGHTVWQSDTCVIEVVEMFPYIGMMDGSVTAEDKADLWECIVPRLPVDVPTLITPVIGRPMLDGEDPEWERDNWFPDYMPNSHLEYGNFLWGFNPVLGRHGSAIDYTVGVREKCGDKFYDPLHPENPPDSLYCVYDLPIGESVPVSSVISSPYYEEVYTDMEEWYYRTFASPAPQFYSGNELWRGESITTRKTKYTMDQAYSFQTVRYKDDWMCDAYVGMLGLISYGVIFSYTDDADRYRYEEGAYPLELEEARRFSATSDSIDLSELVDLGDTLHKNIGPLNVIDYYPKSD